MMNMLKCGASAPCACKNGKDWALLALRLALGVIFILHGYDKLWGGIGMDAFTGMVAKIGFPAPAFFAYVAALAEFFGGIALLVGVATGISSVLLIIVMLVAIFGLKGIKFPMIDTDVSLIAMLVTVLLMGPGRYSVVGTCCKGCEADGSCCNRTDMNPKMSSGKK